MDFWTWCIFAGLGYNIGHWYYLWSKVRKLPCNGHTASLPDVSVVLCTRNRAALLKAHLPTILHQKYDRFEVVVVDDGSTDDTAPFLEALAEKCPHLVVLRMRSGGVGKKRALYEGIRKARHSWIVVTDDDCRPASPHWLRRLMECRDPSAGIVVGYSPMMSRPGLHNALFRWDTWLIAVQYTAWTIAGKPYMAVGRNMAFERQLFFKCFSHIQPNEPWGTDDLLVQCASRYSRVSAVVHPESFVYTTPPDGLLQWWRRKLRHQRTAGTYPILHVLQLSVFTLSQWIVAIAPIAALWSLDWRILALWLGRQLWMHATLRRQLAKWREEALIKYWWWYEMCVAWMYIALVVLLPSWLGRLPRR